MFVSGAHNKPAAEVTVVWTNYAQRSPKCLVEGGLLPVASPKLGIQFPLVVAEATNPIGLVLPQLQLACPLRRRWLRFNFEFCLATWGAEPISGALGVPVNG